MRLRNASIEHLFTLSADKQIVCFGAGKALYTICRLFRDVDFFEKIDYIVDNDVHKQSKPFVFDKKEKPVHSLTDCLALLSKEPVFIITSGLYVVAIFEQLNKMPELDEFDCYINYFMHHMPSPYRLDAMDSGCNEMKIPKTIHYCWFGGNPIPPDLAHYMESWHKCCPDYEIVRWDESNYNFRKNFYMREAYECEKWAFVSDYARLDVIFQHGGIYLDADVELVKNLDRFLYEEAFCGFQSRNCVNFGVGFGAKPGFPLIKEVMDIYDHMHFVNANGSLNLTPCPVYQTNVLQRYGLQLNNRLQKIAGMTVYPTDVLSPLTLELIDFTTENTHAKHWFAGSWGSAAQKEQSRRANEIMSYLYKHMTND